MTKKDYELIAGAIYHHRKSYGFRTDAVVKEVIYSLCEALKMDNDKFDEEKFRRYCENGEEL